MYVLKLKEVDCKSCISEIGKLLTALDNQAEVGVDLLNSEVRVQTKLPLGKVQEALSKDGFVVESAQDRS
jgi:copper chaperone CopZ